jgi:hypothetical protein
MNDFGNKLPNVNTAGRNMPSLLDLAILGDATKIDSIIFVNLLA